MARRSDWGHTELLPGMNVIVTVCYSFLKDIHVCIMRSNYKIDSKDTCGSDCYARCELMYLELSTCEEVTQDTC